MTTLNNVISSIDEKIALAEQSGAVSSYSDPKFSVQEKMIKYVLVQVQADKLAIPISGLTEIGPMPAITPLPNLPSWIHGIVNQRGDIISVIDMNSLLHGGEPALALHKKLAVLHNATTKVGICVDTVIATISRPESDQTKGIKNNLIQFAPEAFSKSLHVNDIWYQILDTNAFLSMKKLIHYYD